MTPRPAARARSHRASSRPLARTVLVLTAVLLASCSSDSDSADSTVADPSTSLPATTIPAPVTEPASSDTEETLPGDDDPETPDISTPDSSTPVTEPAETVPDSEPPQSTPPETDPLDEAPTDRPPTIDELLDLDRPIVLAHAGGEDVQPHSTPFGYAESVAAGVDMLDFDVQLTEDGVLVVQHDDTVDRTTNATGGVAEMTYDELDALDNAYWFTLDCGTCKDRPEEEYLYRGVRTGARPAPDGYTAEDFVIPRFRDIVTRFPLMPLNIEIKGTGDAAIETARVLAEELTELDRLENAVVTSFEDDVNDAFREFAPDVEITPGLGAASAWVLDGEALPDGMRILQLPPEYQGIDVLTPEVVAASAEAGYPIWVWPNDRSWENPEGYDLLLNMGMAGLNANDPAVAIAAVETYLGDGDGIEPGRLTDDAIAAVEAALAEGDSLGDCPYGPTADLVAALPDRLPLAEGYALGVEENGQVFYGGDVDIVYCEIETDDGSGGPIDRIRVDVAALDDVELATYLPEEFTNDDVATHFAGQWFGGEMETGCWEDTNIVCGAFWQGDGIFIATVLFGEADQKKPDAVTVAKTLVPLVMERLAAAAT